MASKTPSLMVSAEFLESVFGISIRRINGLGIRPEIVNDERCYPLNDIVTRCSATVTKAMAERTNSGLSMGKETIKTAKLQAQARKLQMNNDGFEASLVDAERHADDFADKVSAIKSIILEIPDLILKTCPEINPLVITIVQAEIASVVNQQALNL